jgi:hypothetical protein
LSDFGIVANQKFDPAHTLALKFMPSSLTWSIGDRDWLLPNMAHHRVMRAAAANQNVLYYFVSGGGLTVKIDNF